MAVQIKFLNSNPGFRYTNSHKTEATPVLFGLGVPEAHRDGACGSPAAVLASSQGAFLFKGPCFVLGAFKGCFKGAYRGI